MSAPQILLAVAGSLFAVLGAAHGVMTLRDISRPKTFRPSDEAVLESMRTSDVAAMPGATLWRAWLGLNLTHCLGLLIFAGLLLGLATGDTGLGDQPAASAGILAAAAAYVAVAARCFFRMPAAVAGLVLVCIAGAWLTG